MLIGTLSGLWTSRRVGAFWICVGREGGLIFGITLGYLVNALLCIPLSCQNMDENMKIQCASFAFLITSILEISVSAAYRIFPFTFSPSYFFGVVKSTSTLTGGLLASPDSAFSFKPRRSLYASTQNLSRPLAGIPVVSNFLSVCCAVVVALSLSLKRVVPVPGVAAFFS